MSGKVFLSHSTKDKQLVEDVFRIIGPQFAEMSGPTFEAGLPTWEVIVRALDRCHVFALFASRDSLSSKWVRAEIFEAKKKLRNYKLTRILVFCIDGTSFAELPPPLRDFAVFLNLSKATTIAAAIQRHLLEIDAASRTDNDDFVGRDKELASLKQQLLDPRARIRGISISGLALLGRAAILSRAVRDLYPSLQAPDRVVEFSVFQSCADIALELYGSVNELITPDQLSDIRNTFVSDDAVSCGKQLYDIIDSLYRDKQFIILSDRGGIINHKGAYTNIVESLLKSSSINNYPTVFVITQRKPIARTRSSHPEIAFLDIDPLSEEQATQYVVQKARAREIELTAGDVEKIVSIGRGHPQNIDYILEKCRQYPPPKLALEGMDDFYDLSRERSKHLLDSIADDLSADATKLLSIIRAYFNIPAEFVTTIFDSYERGANACAELLDRHAIVSAHGIYSVSPPLWDAVDREVRFSLTAESAREVASKFVAALLDYREDGLVPVNIIDAASVAAIQTGKLEGNWTSQFVLPSHYIYLARYSYDRRQFKKAIEYANSATAYRSSLTDAAFIQACRTLGMSGARIGDEGVVAHAVAYLNGVHDPYAQASGAFIRGFSFRLSGRFSDAEGELKRARKTLGDDFALMRELAIVHTLMRQFDQAISYGEVALARSPENPYLLDVVARARIGLAKDGRALEYDRELSDIMDRLEKFGTSSGMSFYHIRLSEKLLKEKKLAAALKSADAAVRCTPDLAAPYLVRSRAHLALGRTKEAKADRDSAKERTQTAKGRHRYYDAEIIRVEIELAMQGRRWSEAIGLFTKLREYQVADHLNLSELIAAAASRDHREHEPDVRAFIERYRGVRHT